MPIPLEIVLFVKFPQITQFMVVSCSCQDPDHLWRSLNLFSLNEWLLDFDLSPYSDSESCLKQDFFHLDIIDIWGQKLFVIRGCSMHCRLLSWIPGLNLLYDSSTLLLVVITKSVSRPSQMSCGGSITHSWEQGSKRMKLHLCNLWASSNQQGSNWEVLLGPWVSDAKGPHGRLIELDSQIIFFPNWRFPTSDGIMMTWLWKKTIFFQFLFHIGIYICIYMYMHTLCITVLQRSETIGYTHTHTHTHTHTERERERERNALQL